MPTKVGVAMHVLPALDDLQPLTLPTFRACEAVHACAPCSSGLNIIQRCCPSTPQLGVHAFQQQAAISLFCNLLHPQTSW